MSQLPDTGVGSNHSGLGAKPNGKRGCWWRLGGWSLGLLVVGLALSILATVRITGRFPFSSGTDELNGEVMQGVLPDIGPVALNLDFENPPSVVSGGAFIQRTGKWGGLDGTNNSGLMRLTLISDDLTNGWLTLKWPAHPAAFLDGTWQSGSGRNLQPVKFQHIAAMRQITISSVLGSAAATGRVVEHNDYPVFPSNWRLDEISRQLRQSWWQPLWVWNDFYRGPVRLTKFTLKPKLEEPMDVGRSVRLLHISDKYLSLYSSAGMDSQPAAACQDETWNFVIENGHPRRFELNELFRSDAPWVERLSSLCRQQLGPLPERATTHRFSAKQMEMFAVLPAGLMIKFDPHDFGVGGDNDFHVMIPWSQIQDLLDENGPARFVAAPIIK